MKPNLTTEPKLISTLEELKNREPIFHHPDKFGSQFQQGLNMV